MGNKFAAHTFPYIEVKNPTARVEHEASTSRIGEDQLFYCQSRGVLCRGCGIDDREWLLQEVFKELPMEFEVEAQKLLGVSLEGEYRLRGAPAERGSTMLAIEAYVTVEDKRVPARHRSRCEDRRSACHPGPECAVRARAPSPMCWPGETATS